MRRLFLLLFFLILVFCFAKNSFAFELNLPVPYSYVNDYAKIMSSGKREELDQKLKSFAQKNQKEVYVVIVGGLQGATPRDYITQLFTKWRTGRKGLDEGALILIAPFERKIIIESGYLIKNVISDNDIRSIIDIVMLPEFAKGNYDSGISDGVDIMMKVVNGEKVFLGRKIFTVNTGMIIIVFFVSLYLIYNLFLHFRRKNV